MRASMDVCGVHACMHTLVCACVCVCVCVCVCDLVHIHLAHTVHGVFVGEDLPAVSLHIGMCAESPVLSANQRYTDAHVGCTSPSPNKVRLSAPGNV